VDFKTMKTNISYICIIVILLALCTFFYFSKTPAPELGSARISNPNDGLDYVNDTELNKLCPFYEPDGATYRSCVLDLLDKERAKIDIKSKIYKEIDSYCMDNAAKVADKYTLGFVDSYNACIFYKLKQIQ
jgi:hypothetical protein